MPVILLKPVDGSQAIPDPRLIERPWKIDGLQALPEKELRAWYDNMNVGFDMAKNEVLFKYKWGRLTQDFLMKPSMLASHDGGMRFVKEPSGREYDDPSDLITDPKDVIRTILKNRIKPGTLHDFTLNGTGEQLIDELVTAQFRMMRELGVERHGSFVRTLTSMKHVAQDQRVEVLVPLDRYFRNSAGEKSPMTFFNIVQKGVESGDVALEYHTHPKHQYPSQGDILLMHFGGQKSILIANRNKQPNEGYAVAEWRPKEGVDLAGEIGSSGMRGVNPLGWSQTTDVREFVERVFEKREYILRLAGERMVFALKPPEPPTTEPKKG